MTQMPDFNKPQPIDPLRKEKNELATKIRQEISKCINDLDQQGGIVEYGERGITIVNLSKDQQFELEGRDDVVVAVVEENDPSTEGFTVIISVVTEYEGEETENDLSDLSIDDQLNVYEALKEMC